MRVGIVGTGFIAGRHLTALTALPDVEVVAVADPDLPRAKQVAGRHGARAHADGLAMLEQEELDAVWLCVPPSAHGPLEAAAVKKDLPFFVEKPLGLDLASAVRTAEAVRAAGLLTCVGYHWRSLSVVQQAHREIGDAPVQLLTGQWLDSTPAAPWWSRRAGSGGQLLEQTTHLVDLARLLAGEISTVQALEVTTPRPEWPDADVPTASAVLLRFTSGAVGTVTSSCALHRRHDVSLQVVTPGQTVALRERALSDHELEVATGDGERVVRTREDPVLTEDRAFVAALREGHDRVPVPYADALLTHAAVCAADRSARSGGVPVDVAAELSDALSEATRG